MMMDAILCAPFGARFCVATGTDGHLQSVRFRTFFFERAMMRTLAREGAMPLKVWRWA
jgi:hypothetical protein